MKKIVLLCFWIYLVLFTGSNADGYHFSIESQSYSCQASASAGSDSQSNSGMFATSASAYTFDDSYGYLLFARASGSSSIILDNAINRLSASIIEIQLYADGGEFAYTSASAAANGSLVFKILPDISDIGSIVQADFSAGSSVSDPSYGETLSIFLNGNNMSYGTYSVPLQVGTPITLSFSMNQYVNSWAMTQSVDEAGYFSLTVPYTPAPVPSSALLLGSGLSLAVALVARKRKTLSQG
jgi:hypothetical protein